MTSPRRSLYSILTPMLMTAVAMGVIAYTSNHDLSESSDSMSSITPLDPEAVPLINRSMEQSNMKRAITRAVIDNRVSLLEAAAAFRQIQNSKQALVSFQSIAVPWAINQGFIDTSELSTEELYALQVIWWVNHMLHESDYPHSLSILNRLKEQYALSRNTKQMQNLPDVCSDWIEELSRDHNLTAQPAHSPDVKSNRHRLAFQTTTRP